MMSQQNERVSDMDTYEKDLIDLIRSNPNADHAFEVAFKIILEELRGSSQAPQPSDPRESA